MVEHVGGLVNQALVGAIAGFETGFQGFLAHLLGHAVDTVAEKAGSVGPLGHLLMALVDEILQLSEEQQRAGFILLAPAGIGAGVTHRAMRRSLNEQRIIIAIHLDAHHIEEITAGLALGPQALAAAAIEAHAPGFLGPGKGFSVHVTHHEHLARGGVLNNGGHQAAALVEVDSHMRLIAIAEMSIAQVTKIATSFRVNALRFLIPG